MSDRIQLTDHFYLDDFLRSEAAARAGKRIEASPEIIENIRRHCVEVLEPIRLIIDRPLIVLSGYRPLWLNQMVGGSTKSEHMEGRASDIIAPGMTPEELSRAIAQVINALPINQLILEFDQWTHISVCTIDEQPRRQILTARSVDRRVSYTAGILAKRAA